MTSRRYVCSELAISKRAHAERIDTLSMPDAFGLKSTKLPIVKLPDSGKV
jgi:hypothetical protein